MSVELFRQFADLLPEAMLLLTADGTILAANQAVEDRLGISPRQLQDRRLADVATDAPEAVSAYLRACARSRPMVLGSLTLARENGDKLPCRAEGAVFQPRSDESPALLLLRLFPKEQAVSQFLALNQRVADLTKEITRRKEVEADLHEKSEWLQMILASIGDAVIATDERGGVMFLNGVAESLTGWPRAEAVGQPLETVFNIVNEQTRQPAENPVSKALREGFVVGLANHTVLIRRDGQDVPIDDSAAPIRSEDGAIAGVVLVFRDVTEGRKAMEARLRLAAIVESSDDAIVSKNLDGIITSWNKAAERTFGYTAEEIVGRPLSILIPPEHPDELPGILARLRRGERIEHYETVRVSKDGTRVDVSLTISPVRDATGKIIGASKIARDITARKRHEGALRFLADASAELAVLVDYESTLRKVARLAVPFFADWCAVDIAEADGSVRRLAVAHVDPSKVSLAHELERRYPSDPNAERGVHNVLRTGRSELVEDIPESWLIEGARDEEHLRILRELGLKSYMCVPIKARGKILGVLSFVVAESGHGYDAYDLTVAEDLAHRAAIAVENARLYQELQDADRRKTEFLATLAHELRNPLAPVRNGLQILRMAGGNPQTLEPTHQMMDRQLRHMVRLIDDLLDISRITRGKIELRKEPLNLASVVHSALETSRSLLDAFGHTLEVRLPEEPIYLDADPTRLTQVFGNILQNAARYTPPGGRIGLTAEREENEAVVRVRDNGLGIPAEMLPRVFDMFTQVNRSLERSQGGLGIGLALVQNLVRLHGGSVQAHSAGLGQGSEFIVRLPVPAAENRTAEAQPREQPAPQPDTARRRILVVDDSVDGADSLAMLLRMMHHEVWIAHDGPVGIELARQHRPDVIFLDIGLPGMNGYEVSRRLREQPELSGVTIVALTGWGQSEDRRRSQEAGFDEHLVKPVDPQALGEILARYPRQ